VVLRAGLGLTWAWWLPLAVAGRTVTQGDGWPTHFPGLLGPSLAALLVTAATRGSSGVGELLRRAGATTAPPRRPGGHGTAALPGLFLGLTCGAAVLTFVYNTCRHSILAAAVWHGCDNLAAATRASQGAVAAVVTVAVMVWAVVLVVLAVRANRRGVAVLAARQDPGRHRTSADRR
jgi:hypothetical protein